jgi:hypothetical protein
MTPAQINTYNAVETEKDRDVAKRKKWGGGGGCKRNFFKALGILGNFLDVKEIMQSPDECLKLKIN